MMYIKIASIQTALCFFSLTSHSVDAEICKKDWESVEICTSISDEDISDPCLDDNTECPYWANIGECKKNPSYMLTNCAKSCNQCPSFFGSQDLCLDLNEECSHWASLGECEENPSYMISNCAKACEKCLSSVNRETKDIDTGIPQSYTVDGMNGAEEKATKAQIEAMKEYASSYLHHPSTTSKSLKFCKNQLDKCAYYASKGLCEEKVIFMMDNCPLACMMCDKAQQFAQCVGMRELQSLPTFVSEDEFDIIKNNSSNENFITDQVQTIDSFFSLKKGNGDWVESEVEYILESSSSKLSTDDQNNGSEGGQWMVRFGNFLTAKECTAIIDLGHTMGLEYPNSSTHVSENNKEQKETHSFKHAKCSHSIELCNDHSILSSIQERISSMISISLDYFEPAEIVIYPEGGSKEFNTLHHDYELHDSWKLAGPRVLSLYIPLSDVEAGGYLGFPIMDWLMIPPQAGQLIMWPNVMSKDPMIADKKMVKEVLPPRKGDLYVLNLRVHLYNYTSASVDGCV